MREEKTFTFKDTPIRFFSEDGEIYVRRIDLGRALKYAQPSRASCKLHSRHIDELGQYSRMEVLESETHGLQEYMLYNYNGVAQFCKISKQKDANEFAKWAVDIFYSLGLSATKIDLIDKVRGE